jgi:hypothetical protein
MFSRFMTSASFARRARSWALFFALASVSTLAASPALHALDGSKKGDGGNGAAPAVAANPSKLIDVAGLPVLRLSGPPHDMGFVHGKVLAAGIKEGIEEFCIKYRCHGIRARYEQIRKRVETEIAFPDAIVEELTGMLEGMKASGVDLNEPLLKRELGLVDLEVLNSVDHWGLFGCSGLTAWGSCTQDGDVLTSRNFDFDVDPQRWAIVRSGLVLVFEPTAGRAFASFAFPGMVGVTTGVNEEGVACFLHVANGTFGGGDVGRTLPLTLLARELIEECAPADAAPLARDLLKEARIRNSFLFRVVTPGKDAPPTTVFEIDSRGFGEQTLPDASKGEPPLLIATNHYRTRAEVFAAIPDSKVRFANLAEGAKKCFATGDHVIDPLEAWAALETVAQDAPILTLHSIVFLPRTLDLWVAFSKVSEASGRPISAPHLKPVKVNLLQLLGRT